MHFFVFFFLQNLQSFQMACLHARRNAQAAFCGPEGRTEIPRRWRRRRRPRRLRQRRRRRREKREREKMEKGDEACVVRSGPARARSVASALLLLFSLSLSLNSALRCYLRIIPLTSSSSSSPARSSSAGVCTLEILSIPSLPLPLGIIDERRRGGFLVRSPPPH